MRPEARSEKQESSLHERYGLKSERDSMRNLVRDYLAYLQVEKGLAANSLVSYRRDLSRLEQCASRNNKRIEDLTRADLRAWIASLSKEGLAPRSISRATSAA